MENASKALIMAAGFLIGIAILTLAVFLYASFGGSANTIQKNIENGNIEQFNNQFLEYTAKTCNTHDIISVVNLASNYNKSNELREDMSYYIKVWIQIGSSRYNGHKLTSEDDLKNFLEGTNPEAGKIQAGSISSGNYILNKFNCTVNYNESTGKINEILFTKIN